MSASPAAGRQRDASKKADRPKAARPAVVPPAGVVPAVVPAADDVVPDPANNVVPDYSTTLTTPTPTTRRTQPAPPSPPPLASTIHSTSTPQPLTTTNPGLDPRTRLVERPKRIQLPPRQRSTPRLHGIATAPILTSSTSSSSFASTSYYSHNNNKPPLASPLSQLLDLGSFLPEEEDADPESPPSRSGGASQQPRLPRESTSTEPQDLDYFSLPQQLSPTVSTGLELGLGGHAAAHHNPDLKFLRPLVVDPDQLHSLTSRAAESSTYCMPRSMFSPPPPSAPSASYASSGRAAAQPIPGPRPRLRPRPLSADLGHSLPIRAAAAAAAAPAARLAPTIPPLRGEGGNYSSAASTPSVGPARRGATQSLGADHRAGRAERAERSERVRSPSVARSNARSSMDSLCATPGDARSPTSFSFFEEPKPVLGALLAGEMVGPPPLQERSAPTTSLPDEEADQAREKSSTVLKVLTCLQALVQRGAQLPAVPDGPLRIVEYGSINGRAFSLLSALLGTLAETLSMVSHPSGPTITEEEEPSHEEFEEPLPTDLIVLHTDEPGTDFRPLMAALDSVPTSYLSPSFQDAYPCAQPFPYFTTRTFGQPVCPRASVDMGISLMDLHWSHPTAAPTMFSSPADPFTSPTLTSPASTSIFPPPLDPEESERELSLFLQARAQELRPGGTLILAYIAQDERDRPSSPTHSIWDSQSSSSWARHHHHHHHHHHHPDEGGADDHEHEDQKEEVWSVLSSLLAPSIQRLVSCGMLKADVARSMLTLPLYPRSAQQSVTVLRDQEHLWSVEWACGLGEYGVNQATQPSYTYRDGSCAAFDGPSAPPAPPSEPHTLRIPHPASTAFASGCLTSKQYTEHLVGLIKNLYESHWSALLAQRAKLSKGAVAYTLDALYDILQARIDDANDTMAKRLARIEFDVCIYALRRR